MSLHFVGGRATIFGGYFLVPFLFSATVVALELAIVAKNAVAQRWVMTVPVALVALATLAPTNDAVYLRFLTRFTSTIGASPMYATLAAAALFYGVGWIRRVPSAGAAFSLSLIGLALFDPRAADLTAPAALHGWPLIVLAVANALMLIRSANSWRVLVIAGLLTAAWSIDRPDASPTGFNLSVAAHLTLLALLTVGALFDDRFAWFLRCLGAAMLLGLSVAATLDMMQPRCSTCLGGVGTPTCRAWSPSLWPTVLGSAQGKRITLQRSLP
jgi:hypothetical protein